MIRWKVEPPAAEEEKPKGFDDFDLRLGDLMRGERATLGKSLLDVQRDLKIKATHIAAIENCDIGAFATPGFVAGYVRSYARYLGMDPEWAYQKFCAEANFTVAHGMSPKAASPRPPLARKAATRDADPLMNPRAPFVPSGERLLSGVQPGAVGSVLVLLGLIGVIGYGGWSVLQEVQRVRLTPVEQTPGVVAELDPLDALTRPSEGLEQQADLVLPNPDALDRLYRPQALDVPVLVARDGPIAAIDPRRTTEPEQLAAVLDEPEPELVRVVEEAPPELAILAIRPAWVRVQAADGTILLERILDAGERYVVPAMEEPPVLRAGNSGSVFFAVNGETYGPAAPGANVARNVVLSPEALTERFALADVEADPELARFIAVAEAVSAN
ncbi:helix-turn-helix domain-containing protein [Plastorhodobacter daqingensis]|uniref:Helix-turn-helix domain-containing protein n=1 Tax=Plastorhodobacter daqingensis TaxID=1387281 RepID=A0ABW2UPK4_9RHOB